MKPQPRVSVVRKARFKFLVLRYRDPATGRERIKSAETNDFREASRRAGKWESELAIEPEHAAAGEMAWMSFIDLYDRQHLRSLAETSAMRSIMVLEAFGREAGIARLDSITPMVLSRWAAYRRGLGNAESTIAGYLATLRAALAWGVSQDLLALVPRFPRVQRAKTGQKARVMKGRPLTRLEFLKMLRAVSGVVGDDRRHAWRFYLRGLWLSGLRLEESINLWWDRPERLCVDMSGRRPMLRVPAEAEKGNRDRLLPITPDFAALLQRVPPERRTGLVFPLPREKAPGDTPGKHWVSHVVSRIGRAAGVVVDARTGKHASAHDFRRSFGARWAVLVMPQVLMELMRHESIETTMRYYVGRQAEATADAAWEAWGKHRDSTGNRYENRH